MKNQNMRTTSPSRLRRRLRGWVRAEEGNALIELGIGLPLMLTLLLGVVTGGLALDRYLTVEQVARNGATMFLRGMNFARDDNKDVLLIAAQDLRITKTGGDGVIYLSRIIKAAPGTANDGLLVVAERHVMGDTQLWTSKVGMPASSIWPDPNGSQPNGRVLDFNEEPSAIADVPIAVNTLPLGESMFVVEVFHEAAELAIGRFWGKPVQMSARVLF